MRIADLKKHVGKEVRMMVFLQDVTESSNKHGNEWVDLIVCDVTGTTTFKIWAEAKGNLKKNPVTLTGTVIEVVGKIDLFQNRGGINVVDVDSAKEGKYKMSDFFPAIEESEIGVLADRYQKLLNMMGNTPLKTLIFSFFTKQRLMKMAERQGGTDHHRFCGGLLLHLVETAEIAVAEAEQYMKTKRPYAEGVDIDVVIAGALLHDVGKLTTLSDVPDGKLSQRGFLVDTATESVLFATTHNANIEQGKRVPDLAPLDHCILMATANKEDAHPRTMEALIVRNANIASIQMDAYSLAFHNDKKKRNGGRLAYSSTLGNYLVRGGMADGDK